MDIFHIHMVTLDIDMGCGLMTWEMIGSIRSSPISIWDILSCRYGIWANDMGDDGIDTVVSHIDMGYLVTLVPTRRRGWQV